uniref:TIR domain-containing protein n=1 Tax=Candidatus Kentrum sp. FW TaxID=2126338 RepID=A0A450SZM1_9GAMM|nr:MAG: TIR domain-containing protein [Candidatus Kentron sp. FW]
MTTGTTPKRFIPRWTSRLSPRRRANPAQGKRFAAFISYKHVSSTSFAAQLERALKSYAKPLLARPRKIFRDEKHFAPGVDLPRLIEEALQDSEYLLLLASPESAKSPWVQDELKLWCRDLKRQEQLIVILLDGDIAVDDKSKQIDWSGTDALPAFMAEHLTTVPLYLDLRELTGLKNIGLDDLDFKHAINGIVARFRGIDPNEMLGEEIRLRRKTLWLRNGAVAALAALTVLSGIFGFLADSARSVAEDQREIAEEKTKEAERSLANNYWASGIGAEEGNDPVAALYDFGKYHALIIGNDDYKKESGLNPLENARRDAEAMSKVLREQYGFETKVLLDATRQEIFRALSHFRKTLGDGDNLLIYYAGHGLVDDIDESTKKGYWLPVDATTDDKANWVSNDDITTSLQAMAKRKKVKHILVVADSCYSGTLTRGVTISLDYDGNNPDLAFYKRLANENSYTVMTSGGIEEVIDGGGKDGHSIFATAFTEALEEQKNHIVRAKDLFNNNIERKVTDNASGQMPHYERIRNIRYKNDGDFLFVRRPSLKD